jgi:hypothetical protein
MNNFRPADTDDRSVLRRATIDACSRQLPILSTLPETSFSEEDVSSFADLLRLLPLDDQLSQDFLVEVPRLEKKIQEVSQQPQALPPVLTTKPKPAEGDLDAWLDDLLG